MLRLLSLILLVVAASPTIQVCLAQAAGMIVVGGSNRCMAMPRADFSNGAEPQTLKCVTGAPAHTWQFTASSAAGKTLLQTADGACLDVPNGAGYNGARLQVWACSPGNSNQYFSRDGNTIRWNGSKYCLDVRDGSAEGFKSHLAIQLWKCNPSSLNQQFLGSAAAQSVSTPSTTTVAKLAKTTAKTTAKMTTKKTTSSYYSHVLTGVTTYSTTAKSATTTKAVTTSKPVTTTTHVASSTPVTTSSKSTAKTTSTSTTAATALPTFSTVPKPALTSIFKPSAKRMLAWGFNDQYAGLIGIGPKISTYMHWENGIVKQMPSDVTYIPTYWGSSLNASWLNVQSQFTSIPGAILGFNEPDIASQANMSPSDAANLYYQNITLPYGRKGANMISPSISWNVNGWLKPFLTQCAQLGCGIDAVGMHFYPGLSSFASPAAAVASITATVNSVYSKFGLPLVLGEIGLTQAGGGTDAEIMDFVQQLCIAMDNNPAVLAYGLSAVFARGAGWDSYLNSNMSFFWANNTLTPIATYYMYN